MPREKSLWTYFVECFTKHYADFSGRARRREYWGFALFFLLICFAWAIIASVGALSSVSTLGDVSNMGSFLAFLGSYILWLTPLAIFFFATIVPMWAVGTRRLHDRGFSGWWIALSFAVSVAYNSFKVFTPFSDSTFFSALTILLAFASFGLQIFLIVQFVLDGEPGANKYGENPKEEAFRQWQEEKDFV